VSIEPIPPRPPNRPAPDWIEPPGPRSDRHLLALTSLRRRQLRCALLHGRSRSWRDRHRVWPTLITGLVILAMTIAGTAVADAFHRQQQIDAPPSPAAVSADR
jgi:hypothetical protein